MNKNCIFKILAGFLLLLTANQSTMAQCPGCTINIPAGTVADTVYVDTLNPAYKNVYYQEEMSFRMPYTTDPLVAVAPPGTTVPRGLNVDYFEIKSVTGLPPGLTWIGDRAVPMRYNESAPQTRDGCITLCGTPAAAGTFTVNVNLEIQVSGFIFPSPPIALEFIVHPDTNATFALTSRTSCAPFFAQVDNRLSSNGNPDFRFYWDFGNGTTSTLENPDSVEYTLSDTGTVSITQQVIIDTFGYYLQNVVVTATDCSDPNLFGSPLPPDMYMKILDGTTEIVNTDPNFSLIGNTQNNESAPDTMVFPGPLRLKSTTFDIEIWDDDNAELNADDQCGSGSLPISTSTGAGQHTATNGGLTISYYISHYIDTVTFVDNILVKNCNVAVEYLRMVERSLQVYPSPTADIVNIKFEMEGWANDVELVISDMLGRTVYTENIANFEGEYTRQVDLSNNTTGVYILQIKMGERIAHRKIVLQK